MIEINVSFIIEPAARPHCVDAKQPLFCIWIVLSFHLLCLKFEWPIWLSFNAVFIPNAEPNSKARSVCSIHFSSKRYESAHLLSGLLNSEPKLWSHPKEGNFHNASVWILLTLNLCTIYFFQITESIPDASTLSWASCFDCPYILNPQVAGVLVNQFRFYCFSDKWIFCF